MIIYRKAWRTTLGQINALPVCYLLGNDLFGSNTCVIAISVRIDPEIRRIRKKEIRSDSPCALRVTSPLLGRANFRDF